MTCGSRLLPISAAILLAVFALRAQSTSPPGSPKPANEQERTTGPATPKPANDSERAKAGDYLGSRACARCHETSNEQWERSLHIRMTKPVAEATIVGDFQTPRFADHGRSYEFGTKDGRPFVRIVADSRAPETFPVDYTLGFKRYQGYLSKLPDGRIYVLPVFWHIESKRWMDWKELAPVPDGAHHLRQIWNVNCFNCHATNLSQGFNIDTKRYDTTWTEMGIGCEACHGPGRDHVALMEAWEKSPATKPAYDNSNKNRELSATLKIFSPRSAAPRQVFDTCAYCHGNKTNMFTGFRGGARYEDYALPFLISAPIPENDLQGEFWPDGRPNRFNRPQAVMQSGCFESGQLACTSCHVAHGSRHPFSLKLNITQGRNGDLLCTQCHTSPGGTEVPPLQATGSGAPPSFEGPGLEKHTFHKPESAGSRCINCHMSDVNWRLLIRRRDHTYRPPVPEMTGAYGVPNACTTCHDDRTPEWAASQMDQWWGNGDRRKAVVSVADTMYRAGSRDTSVAPALARLAIDRSQPAFVRASAADFLSEFMIATRGGGPSSSSAPVQSQTSIGYGTAPALLTLAPFEVTPAMVNALIGAAADPEAIVRASAVRGLGAAPDQARVLSPLTARLVDSARVVRARTAEVLIALGIAQLPGAAGAALTRAQDDYVASLRSFPDIAANHAAIAWLEAQRGRLVEAGAAASDALRVDDRAARPWVVKGVILARERKYAEALEAFKKARSLEPSYPNIDRLISEAEKLRK